MRDFNLVHSIEIAYPRLEDVKKCKLAAWEKRLGKQPLKLKGKAIIYIVYLTFNSQNNSGGEKLYYWAHFYINNIFEP